MYDQPITTQLTIYYRDGHIESFHIHPAEDETALIEQQFNLNIRQLLDSPWWILHLPEQTVFINLTNVLKIEASPPLAELHGRDVIATAERITALNRAGSR